MTKSFETKDVQFFSGRSIGRGLREIAVDFVKTHDEDLVSRWYQGPSTDLYTWSDRKNNIIKQQLNFNGQIVEWNCLEGLKTGVIVETDLSLPDEAAVAQGAGGLAASTQERVQASSHGSSPAKGRISENIQFDRLPEKVTVGQALEILKYAALEGKALKQIVSNFENPQNIHTLPTDEFFRRYGSAMNGLHQRGAAGFWSTLKTRLSLFFKRR
jgi:hypothetical protein